MVQHFDTFQTKIGSLGRQIQHLSYVSLATRQLQLKRGRFLQSMALHMDEDAVPAAPQCIQEVYVIADPALQYPKESASQRYTFKRIDSA